MIKRFFRRKSNAEVELQNDYPTNSDTDEFTDDERRRQEWQQHLNRRATVANVGHHTNIRDENWEYESEYNYSVGSETSIIDAFRENKYTESPRFYSEQDLERRIEHAMRKEFSNNVDSKGRQGSFPSSEESRQVSFPSREDRRNNLFPTGVGARRGSLPTRQDSFHNEEKRDVREKDRRQSLYPAGEDKWERFSSGSRPPLSPVSETVRQFEQKQGKRRASYVPTHRFTISPTRRDSGDNNSRWKNPSKRKVRKQMKHRKRARDVSSDFSDDDDAKKYSVNLTMEDLNDLIKKNIDSAVKTLASDKSKSKRRLSPNDSFSTETETIFSGSSSHSTDVPSGLLHKHIKAQLDKDNLRGIIKNAVAKETNSVLQNSFNSSTPTPGIPKINEIPPTPTLTPSPSPYLCHYGNQHTAPHYVTSTPMQTSHIPPAPPPPPLPAPSVTFSVPNGTPSSEMAMYSHCDTLNVPHNQTRRHSGHMNFDSPQDLFNSSPMPTEHNFNNYHTLNGVPQAAFNRLQNRRHTLAAIDAPSDISSFAGDKIEQFSNALKLLDQTIKQAESDSKSAEDDKKESDKNESNKPGETKTSTSDDLAPLPVGVLAPFQGIADQIAALSKKKETPLEVGQIPMSSCARTFLILSNIVFLIVGCGLSGLGVWMMTDPNIETYFNILNVDRSSSNFKLICYALIAVGAIAFLIAFMGCCGAINKSKCLLTMFLVMVAVLTVLEVGLGVMVIIGKDGTTVLPVLSSIMSDMAEKLKAQLKLSITEHYLPDTMIGTTWDMVQIELECCGASGPEDYKYSRWTNETRPETDYPDTCCVLMSKDADVPEPSNKLLCHFGTAGFYFETGCYEKMVGWFKDNSVYIIGSFAAILVMEVVGFISAFLICRKGVKQKAKDSKTKVSK